MIPHRHVQGLPQATIMLRYLGQRLMFIAMVSVAVIFITHMGMRMVHNSDALEPSYDLVRFAQLGWQDTRAYLTNALHNELGSARTSGGNQPVLEILKRSYVNSMGLLLVALISATLLGILIGTSIALTKWKLLITVLLSLTVLGMSTPAFFGGLLLQRAEIFYVSRGGGQLVKLTGFGWDYKHMLLPVLVLMGRPLAFLTRASFISLKRIMGEDYIRTAYAKGLSVPYTVVAHAMKNMYVPFLTAVMVSLRFSLVTLPVVEFFFIWPGIGLELLQAINLRQTTLAVTLILALGLTLLIVNLLLDIAYKLIDPRLRDLDL